MNFKEIENIEYHVAATEAPKSELQKQLLTEYLEKEKKKTGAKENPFVFFYEDVISESLQYNFETTLGTKSYKNASKDALGCLNICPEFFKLSSWAVDGWLQNALKFTDHIVLHYIQDYCNETPKTYPKTGVEKSRYKHISEKDGDISVAGSELTELYDLRNKLEHRTITHPDGRQELVPPRKNKVRRLVVKLYPDALRRILKTYKTLARASEE